MPPLSELKRAFRLGLRRSAAAEVDEELRFHLDMRAAQLEGEGFTPEGARAEALRRFGDVEAARGRLHHGARRRKGRMLRRERFEGMLQDVGYAVRQLRRSPGFAMAAVLTLGIAIAANATMFGIVDRLLLRPPALLRDPSTAHRVFLVRFRPEEKKEFAANNITYKRYRELGDSARTLAASAAFASMQQVVGTGNELRQLQVGQASASLWGFFDVRPALGRFFTASEDRIPTGEAVAVLGYDFWRSQFGGRADALGKTIRVENVPYTIIGVAPEGFNGMSKLAVSVWVPITTSAYADFGDRYWQTHNISWMEMLVRRKPGVATEEAQSELTRLYAASMAADRDGRRVQTARPRAILASTIFDRGPRPDQNAKVALWLAGVAGVVLLIACANVANLLLARATRRGREIAVRVALGVGRGRLVSQLLTESLLIGLFGGAVGLVLAVWGGGLLRTVLLPDVDWSGGALDERLLAATALAAIVAGTLAGVTPALQAGRVDVSGALKAGGREGSVRRSRTRDALLVLQVALSLVLLIGAGIFARSLHNVRSLDLGFDPERVLFVSAELGSGRRPESERRPFVERLLARARELPQVEHASRTATVPYYMSWADDLRVPGIDSVEKLGEFLTNAVSPDYFATMGTRIVRGRTFTDADRAGAGLVAIVDESMARTLWPGGDPIGRCIKVGGDSVPCTTVVGVAQSIRSGSFSEPTMIYYLPEAQDFGPGTGLFVRTRGPARESSEAVRRELQKMAPGNVYVAARPLQDLVDPQVRPWMLGATMFSAFGAVALLLAAVGLYGVIAFNVAQRAHEVGVRIALGATTRDILRLVVGDGVRVAAVGIALGGAAALAAGRFVAPLLFEVSPRDPLTMGVVVATLLAIAVAASWIPGWRASRVNPNEALRAD